MDFSGADNNITAFSEVYKQVCSEMTEQPFRRNKVEIRSDNFMDNTIFQRDPVLCNKVKAAVSLSTVINYPGVVLPSLTWKLFVLNASSIAFLLRSVLLTLIATSKHLKGDRFTICGIDVYVFDYIGLA